MLTFMTAVPAALLGIAPVAPPPLLAWRIDSLQYAENWHSGIGSERFGGRWNPKGVPAVYCSVDPATCLVEAAVHRGFDVLDTQPHVLSCVLIEPLAAPAGAASALAGWLSGEPAGDAGAPGLRGVRVVQPHELPNPAWLHGGTPSAGQQRFGADLLAEHGVVLLPSAVSKSSWNLVFSPAAAAGRFHLKHQQRLVVDTRLNRAP